MDRKLPKKQEIERLIRLGAAARSCLEMEAILLKQRLDVPARIRGSLKDHPAAWLFGSLASGLAASMLLPHKAQAQAAHAVQKKRRSIPHTLLGLTLTAVRPMAKVWLTDQVKNYIIDHFRSSTATSTQFGQPHPSKPL